jgi:hypothetical protein
MRTLVLAFAVVLALAARGQPPQGAAAVEAVALVTADSLVGAWRGEWTAAGQGAHGMVELILGRVSGRQSVIGQFTFVTGGHSRTLRYEGRIEDNVVRFTLVGGGRIVLKPEHAPRPELASALEGHWTDARGALPSDAGTLTLDRIR